MAGIAVSVGLKERYLNTMSSQVHQHNVENVLRGIFMEVKELGLTEYREFVRGCIHPGVDPWDLPFYAECGYCGEWGEFKQVLSKALRSVRRNEPLPDDRWEQLVQECGDILHYQVMYSIGVKREAQSFDIIPIYRDMTVSRIAEKSIRCPHVGYVPIPNMSIEQLAYINQQKLLTRREQIGTFAKD